MPGLSRRLHRVESVEARRAEAGRATLEAGMAGWLEDVARWEAANGPLTPLSPDEAGLYPGTDYTTRLRALTDRELMGVLKHWVINGESDGEGRDVAEAE